MKIDNALVAALIAIGFFTCEANAKIYVSKLSADKKVELMEVVKTPLKQSKKIMRDGHRCGACG